MRVIMSAIIGQAGRPFNVDEAGGVSRRHRASFLQTALRHRSRAPTISTPLRRLTSLRSFALYPARRPREPRRGDRHGPGRAGGLHAPGASSHSHHSAGRDQGRMTRRSRRALFHRLRRRAWSRPLGRALRLAKRRRMMSIDPRSLVNTARRKA
jgi:hypothetical protein